MIYHETNGKELLILKCRMCINRVSRSPCHSGSDIVLGNNAKSPYRSSEYLLPMIMNRLYGAAG